MHKDTISGGLDYFRLAAALLVAAIHTSPLTCFSAEADFFLTRILARVAVPFFLMVTGEFMLPRILAPGPGAARELRRYLTRTGRLYLMCILLYLPLGIYAGHYRELTLAKALRLLVWDGTFYHLWYFPACMLGMTLLYLLGRRLGTHSLALVCGVLYLLGLCGDSYYGLTALCPPLRELYDLGFLIWSHTRNGLFLAPLFLLMGAYMGEAHGKNDCPAPAGTALPALAGAALPSPAVLCVGLALALAGMTGEAFLLRSLDSLRHDSMYVLLVPVMYCLYGLLLRLQVPARPKLRRIATLFYILHPAVIIAVRICARLPYLRLLTEQSLVHFLAVCLLSLTAAWLLMSLTESLKKQNRTPASKTGL